jgi:hypothetical protein
MKSVLVLALGVIALATTPSGASASLITGILNATGTAEISSGSISFVSSMGSTLFINNPAAGQGGGFTALAGTTGNIMNITDPPDATGPLNVPNFVTFASAPNITFTLTFLSPGIDGAAGCSAAPPAAGQRCTPDMPAQSPFNLQNTSASTSTASFNIQGTEVDSITGDTIQITGTFTTPFTTQNFQHILATVEGGGTVVTAFSAQFATVPEPGTWIELMIGLGSVGIGASSYGKKLRKKQ